MNSGPNRTLPLALWAASFPALLAASYLYYPYCFDGPVVCPMAFLLGLPCPGCGLTRAFCLMAHGRFAEAAAFHGLAPFVLVYLAFLWIYKIVETVRGTPPRLPTYRIGATAALILVGFWIARLGVFFAQGGLEVVARQNVVARMLRLLG